MDMRPSPTRPDSGMTLVELLIVILILPVFVGTVALAIFSAFSVQKTVRGSVSGSSDLQAVSSTFYKDSQSAKVITTSSTPKCGTGTQLLGLGWDGNTTSGYSDIASYDLQPNSNTPSGTTTDSFVRNYCTGGSSTPTSVTIVSNNVSPQQPPPDITSSSSVSGASSGWVSASGVSNIKLSIREVGNNLTYNLDSLPQVSSLSISPSSPPQITGLPVVPGTATITWSNAGSGTGQSILYTATATDTTTPANGGQSCTSTGTSCTISGLTSGDIYTFSVTP